MPAAFPIALPLVLAAVLIAGAVGKLRTPDDLSGWAALGVPSALRREWLRRVHPWAELALGLAVALLGGWLGVLASLAALGLMIVYTVLVARAAGRHDDTSCACFGAPQRVSRVTVVRNAWLVPLAAASTAVVWRTPLFGGAALAGIPQWSWVVALAVAAVTTLLILWPVPAVAAKATDAVAQAVAASQTGDDDLDYIRTRTPAVPVTLADGTIENLQKLSARKPILLLAVSSICGACESVVEKRGEYRALLPEVDVRLLFAEPVEMGLWTEHEEPQSLHDAEDYVGSSIGYVGTPTAVLLGADGLLAGGPVTGDVAVDRFVEEIYESLHGERPPREVGSGDGSPA